MLQQSWSFWMEYSGLPGLCASSCVLPVYVTGQRWSSPGLMLRLVVIDGAVELCWNMRWTTSIASVAKWSLFCSAGIHTINIHCALCFSTVSLRWRHFTWRQSSVYGSLYSLWVRVRVSSIHGEKHDNNMGQPAIQSSSIFVDFRHATWPQDFLSTTVLGERARVVREDNKWDAKTKTKAVFVYAYLEFFCGYPHPGGISTDAG